MNVVQLHTRAFVFWSADLHRKYDGATTIQGYARFKPVKANWIGPSIGGDPGVVQDGHIVRPEGLDTYQLIGPFEEHEYFFTTLDAALPAHVFAVEEERRAKVLAERDRQRKQYEANLRASLEHSVPKFDRSAMLRTALETGERLMKRMSERAPALYEPTAPTSTETPSRRGLPAVTSVCPDTPKLG